MRLPLAICSLGLVSGCLYTDPINQRPSLDIERELPAGEVHRGDSVVLKAIANDPENQQVYFQWRAYSCNGDPIGDINASRPGCDAAPFYTELLDHARFDVRTKRDDTDEPVQQILVLLEGEDEYGATAKPIQQLTIAVSNHPPDVRLSMDSRYSYVAGYPINIFAKIGDPDDGPSAPTVDWQVYTPMNQPPYTFVDLVVAQDPMDPSHLQLGKTFTPSDVGPYEIDAVATDPVGDQGSDKVTITVGADDAPCLRQWAPLDAPSGTASPMTDPTLFQVTVVDDALDPWPSIPDGPIPDMLSFHWSLLPPGSATRVDLPATGDHVALDPASYSPLDILELRVEIKDRSHPYPTSVSCADNSLTCSSTSDSCIQRLTWRVEVR